MSDNSTPSLDTALRRMIDAALRQVCVCEPGQILAYDADALVADVQPLLLKSVPTETGNQLVRQAPVTHAPVLWPGGGGSRLTFPVAPGDQCLLLVPSRPIDQWSAFGTEVDPKNTRRHHITDAIVLCGLQAPSRAKAAHATATVLEANDLRLGDENAAALALKSDAKGFFDIISSWSPVPNDGGAALKAAFNSYVATHPTWPSGTSKVKGT